MKKTRSRKARSKSIRAAVAARVAKDVAIAVANVTMRQVEDQVASLIWQLLRDEVPFGTMEEIVQDMERHPPPYKFGDKTAQIGDTLSRHMARRLLRARTKSDPNP